MLALLFLGGLMLSTFRYWSGKRIDLRQRQSYRMIFPLAAVLVVVIYHPPAFFLAVAVLYIFSAPVLWLRNRWFPQSARQQQASPASEADR